MANQNFELAEQLLRQLSSQISIQDSDFDFLTIQNDINQLRALYRKLKTSGMLKINTSKQKTKLAVVGAGIGELKFNEAHYDILQKDFEKDIIEAYFLSEKILSDLHLIDSVQYSTIYNSAKGNVYYRYSGEDILKNNAYLELLNDGIIRLRLNAKSIQAELRSQGMDARIQRHYQDFIMPIYKHLKKIKTVAFNQGHAAEAFERHWEKLNHSVENFQGSQSDLGTIAERWALYIQSRGNAPFYTGPDTLYSQVKRSNASLLSNINTLLYTIQAILRLTSTNSFDQIAFESLKNVLNGFGRQKNIEENIKKILGEGLDSETENLIQDVIKLLSSK